MSATTINGSSSATTSSLPTPQLTQRTSSNSTIPQPLPPAHVFQSTTSSISAPLLPATLAYKAHGDIPNTPLSVSIISTILGGILFTSFTLAGLSLAHWVDLQRDGWGAWARPQLGVYLGCLAGFHLMEFWVTAGWNKDRLSVDAFLLNNGKAYPIAHAVGLAEWFLWSYLWPRSDSWWMRSGWMYFALPMLMAAQALRTLAMVHASSSFSHEVSRGKKADDHVLVTWGVYRFSRHPSYTGFFYWAVATQLMLGNVVSIVGFVYVLAKFFEARIIDEERHLVRFFGQDYVDFRTRVGTWLPAGLVSREAR